MRARVIHQLHRWLLCPQRNLEVVLLKLGSEMSKDFKLIVDLCFGGNYDEAIRKALVMLVKKEKLLREINQGDFVKVVDEIFDGDEDRAVREAINLLLEKCKAI